MKTKYLKLTNYFKQISSLIFDVKYSKKWMIFLFLVEVIINFILIKKIKYTEIDWGTYMQQVECFLNGTLDYSLIKGDTGPVVYPAGHIYVYSLLYYLTDNGTNILRAQYIFSFIYLINLLIIFSIYINLNKVQPIYLILMCLSSYRVHSIFVLRLFNDCIAIFFLYLSIVCFIKNRWYLGCLIYSLSVSIKMNILLFAPALLILLLENSLIKTIICLSICALVQIVLGWPFIISYPQSYLINSFNLGRVFLHKWTVNWRFLPEKYFIDYRFHLLLLCLHLTILLLYYRKRITNVWRLIKNNEYISRSINNNNVIKTFFVSNFIGICFARSLHYQFYIWYYHQLPYLFYLTKYPFILTISLQLILEFCWIKFPSSLITSLLLHLVHFFILIGVFKENSVNNKLIQNKTSKIK